MPASNHLGFDFVSASQAQKEVTVNTALRLIDALMNTSIIDKDLTTPPGSPSEGDVYIPAATLQALATNRWGNTNVPFPSLPFPSLLLLLTL